MIWAGRKSSAIGHERPVALLNSTVETCRPDLGAAGYSPTPNCRRNSISPKAEEVTTREFFTRLAQPSSKKRSSNAAPSAPAR
jgi:hypothetical protein